jgi:mRNA-degrading endonuclease toxin of MazEF toxin-antitoxin module
VALIRRGEVWVARLNPNHGAEVGWQPCLMTTN